LHEFSCSCADIEVPLRQIHILAVMVCMVLGLTLSPGRQAVADEQHRLSAAHEIVALTHAADNMRTIIPTMMTSLRPMLSGKGVNPATVDAVLNDFQTKASQQTDQMVDLIAAVYAREFTDEDLDALVAFYHTPAGEHLVAKQPEILKGMLAVGQQWGQMIAKQTLDDLAQGKIQPKPKL
jgi:uncharacterized protein